MKKLVAFLMFAFTTLLCQAQDKVEMADVMRSNGKIYVVVGVVSIIMLGIIIYLVVIDRKVSDLEKRIPKK